MYPAEFGGKASALINVATKAGSNAFHGSVFEFHRNEALDARNYFHPRGPADAAAAPEPVRRRARRAARARTARSSSAATNGTRMRRSLTRTFSVPTAAVRAGNFAGLGSDLRPADDSGHGRLRAVCEQPDSRQPHRPDRGGVPAATCRCQPPAHAVQNLAAVEASTRALDQFSARARSPPDGRRPAVRALQHLRRRRAAAVRHQRAAGSADPGVRPDADHEDAQRRGEPHARLRQLDAERAACGLDDASLAGS